MVAIFSVEQNQLDICFKGPYKKHLCVFVLKFGTVVLEEMLLKDISYIQLWLVGYRAL